MSIPPRRPDGQATGSQLLTDVSNYYTSKLQQHGTTPRGVDWNGTESQQLRFAQLSRIMAEDSSFSINDLGCGYGAFLDYLETKFTGFTYVGCDVSAAMIAAARERHRTNPNVHYHETSTPPQMSDYGVASGIFNVRMGHDAPIWRDYVKATLVALDRTSRRGFAFNCLTTYSDPEKARADLFYADPCEMFDYCKRSFSRNVALLHDYGLYEFTMLVRKAP